MITHTHSVVTTFTYLNRSALETRFFITNRPNFTFTGTDARGWSAPASKPMAARRNKGWLTSISHSMSLYQLLELFQLTLDD